MFCKGLAALVVFINLQLPFIKGDESEEPDDIKFTCGLDCNKTFFSDGTITQFKDKVHLIFPGTLWCGAGNIADSDEDLGVLNYTDFCCRQHDMCPKNIAAGDTKYGLTNNGLFTRSHCDCDEKFHNCLKEANTVVSNGIGFTYFTVLGPQCFKKEYPIIRCIQRESLRCVDYETDRNKDRTYEWFDNPIY